MITEAGFLDCPSCEQPCRSLPARKPTAEFPGGWWRDGDEAVCQCGAAVSVEADGENAWLNHDEEFDPEGKEDCSQAVDSASIEPKPPEES